MQSVFYSSLSRRIALLKKVFLPLSFSPTGRYRDSTYEKVNAYIVLSHAEMEQYFESVVTAIASDACKKWRTNKEVGITVLSLVAYYSGKYNPIPEQKNGNNSLMDVDELLPPRQNARQQLRQNAHG